MARKRGKRSSRKLEPPLPEVQDELHLPKYFGMIRGGGYNSAKEGRREAIPVPMPKSGRVPGALSGRKAMPKANPYPEPAPETERVPLLIRAAHYVSTILGVEPKRPVPMPKSGRVPGALSGRKAMPKANPYPEPAPEPERVPLLIRAARYVSAILKVEPDRPVSMPVVPEMNFPALYTRFPLMKTVTKTTDAAGEISVTYSQSFKTVPGVVITVKDPDNVFGTVFSTTLTGFDVRLFKMAHDHGGTVDDGGKHTPTINADGGHAHDVQGTYTLDLDTKYGRLVLANNTDYEKDHVHTQTNTWYEKDHVHTNPVTGANNRGHTHGGSTIDACDDNYTAVSSIYFGSSCASGSCVTNAYTHSYANNNHVHSCGVTGGESQNHTHTQGNTGGVDHLFGHRHGLDDTGVDTNPLGHRHLISDDLLYQHYVYDVELTLDLVTSATEAPLHAHTGDEIAVHKHDVPEDGRVLLQLTPVTITYLAQEESS